jgi:hypothetical protein
MSVIEHRLLRSGQGGIMARTIFVFLIGVIALSIVVLARADSPSEMALRNLRLNAAGTEATGPGQLRIPVPVDGVLYEVVVANPGEPKLIAAAPSDAD